MQDDQRNLFLAIALSLAVVFLWQMFFIERPTEEELAAQQAQEQSQTADLPAGAGEALPGAGTLSGSGTDLVISRQAALELSPRVPIETPSVRGSISLVGARIDDLHLHQYRETIDPDSPEITLMSPAASEDARYAELGWHVPTGGNVSVPTPSTLWQVVEPDAQLTPDTPVTLQWSNGQGLTFTRTFSIDENYMFTVTQAVTNSTGQDVTLHPYGIVARRGEPDGQRYWISFEGLFGYLNGSRRDVSYKRLRNDGAEEFSSSNGWLGITDKYWMTVLIPEQGSEFNTRFTVRNPETDNERFQAAYVGSGETVPAGGSAEVVTHFFAGAKVVDLIDGYRDDLGIQRFDLSMDWGWFFFLTKPYFWALDHLNQWVGNFGLAILIFTVFIKLAFFPIANKSYESMSKMRKVQPEMERIREQFKDDKVRQQQEMMELYKREKLNPLAGCLPIFIQIPVFFALYKVLFITIEMRHAPFYGWVHDLSAPDPTSLFNLFGLLPWTSADLAAVPMIGGLLTIGAWPLIMGFTMWFQMQLNPPPPDPMQRRMFQLMPIFFTFILANFAAGLVIYWAWNNTLSILQQYVIMKRMGTWENPLSRIKLPGFLKLPAAVGAAEKKAVASPAPAPAPAEEDEAVNLADPTETGEGEEPKKPDGA